jgi:chaperonin GroES
MKTVIAVKDKVVVKVIRQSNITKGGIIIPDNVESAPQAYGEVISVGEEVKNIKPGDILLFAKFGGQDIMLDGVIYKVLIDNEIYGILKEEEIL